MYDEKFTIPFNLNDHVDAIVSDINLFYHCSSYIHEHQRLTKPHRGEFKCFVVVSGYLIHSSGFVSLVFTRWGNIECM